MSSENLENSLLAKPENLPSREPETVKDYGKTLIVAPHPDDESLGCGGAIALLTKFKCDVNVVVVSDGTLSHPNSKKFPPEKLRDLREREMLEALRILSVSKNRVEFWRYKDRSVPNHNSPDFEKAVERCVAYLLRTKPQTVFVPWRRDPHPDHLASYRMFKTAIDQIDLQIKIIEYPIWLWEIAQTPDAPQAFEVKGFKLDISSVSDVKQQAIHAHKSQITDLIDDDETAFRLTPEILRHFETDYEIYFESL